MIVLLSNRGDAGFDSRTLTNVGFRPGQVLVELTGNAADPQVNPRARRPARHPAGHPGVRGRRRQRRSTSASSVPARSARPGSSTSTDAASSSTACATPHRRCRARGDERGRRCCPASSIHRTTARTACGGSRRSASSRTTRFEVRLRTSPVRLLGSNDLRDVEADGDQALLRVDGGRDVNGNGTVDFKTPGTTEYGFERFVTKSSPLIGNHSVSAPRGDGEFRQTIDAARLEEGLHFLTARAYRHRAGRRSGGVQRLQARHLHRSRRRRNRPSRACGGCRQTRSRSLVRSQDATADGVHVLANVPASTTDAAILTMVEGGQGRCDRIDRALFRGLCATWRPGPRP